MTKQPKSAEAAGRAARLSIWQSAWFNTLGRFLALLVVFLFFALLIDAAISTNVFRFHPGIAKHVFHTFESLQLNFTRSLDPLTNRLRALPYCIA